LILRAALRTLLVAAALAFPALPSAAKDPGPEKALAHVLQAIEARKLDVALTRVDALIAAHPNFRLAHLIRGDLLLARRQPLQGFGNTDKTVPREKVEDLRAEALARMLAHRERPADKRVPHYMLQMHEDQRHALVVDSRRSRLFVFENVEGRPRYVADYYVTLGKQGIAKTREGDQKTPIGVYHVTGNLPRQKLTDFYGAGAFPINYPNAWDRRQGRNGHGIWLHGTPSDTYSRPPLASDGCIVLSNPDVLSLSQYLQVGVTPVIISDSVEWIDAGALEAERKGLLNAIDAWRKDWESRDTDRYLANYAADFRSEDQGRAEWAAHKRRVNAGKSWIKVELAGLAMFRYPRENFVIVSFDQDYSSSNLSNSMRKRQYWKKEGVRWRILYEGSA
jgi:murein L,D-transpeptidase YafK